MPVELEYHDNAHNSHKFWRVEVEHRNLGQTDEHWAVTAEWGRVGSNGQAQTWAFDGEERARRAAKHKTRQKRRKGYLDVQAPTPTSPKAIWAEAATTEIVTVELDAHEKPRVVVTIRSYEPGYRLWVDGGYADAHKTADGIAELLRFVVEGYECDEGYRIWKYDVADPERFAALARWLSNRDKPRVKSYSRDEMLAVDVATEFNL